MGSRRRAGGFQVAWLLRGKLPRRALPASKRSPRERSSERCVSADLPANVASLGFLTSLIVVLMILSFQWFDFSYLITFMCFLCSDLPEAGQLGVVAALCYWALGRGIRSPVSCGASDGRWGPTDARVASVATLPTRLAEPRFHRFFERGRFGQLRGTAYLPLFLD